MERLLRSIIQVGGVPDSAEAHHNWIKLLEYDLEFSVQEDKSIFDYLKKFYDQMSSPPDYALVKEYFEKQDQIETVERLEEIKKAQFYIQTNYLAIIRAELERQQTKNFAILCRDASAIAEHGRNLDKPVGGKKILKGVNDAVNYVFDKLHRFTEIEGGEKLEGVVSEDADEVIEETELVAKTSKFANRNLFGLEPVDSVCKGHRSGEYWIHCGFAGELKSSLAMNYMYNNVYVYGKNIFYAILEMPYTQLRRALFVLHSSHGKFITDWYDKDRKAGLKDPYQGIDYRKVRDGELNELEFKRFKIIAQDFRATAKGKPFIWRPKEDVTIDDIRRKAEMFHNKFGCDGIIIDHLGLVKPKYRSNDTVARINDVVREGRLMALNFGRGKTVPILALFQLNRQGKLRADKNDGRYDFAAISYANECCAEGTIIETDRGLVPIEDVEPNVDRVWSRTGWKSVLNKFDNGIKPTIDIETDRGLTLSVTNNHRIRVFENSDIKWKYARDMHLGDIVAADFGTIPFPEEPPYLLPLAFGRGEKPADASNVKLQISDKLTTDLAYLIGAYLGDGNYKPQTDTIGFTCNVNEKHVQSELMRVFISSFGQRCGGHTSPSRSSVYDMRKCSKALIRWFKATGLNRKPGIPEIILLAPRQMINLFMRGLFDTDGHVNTQGIITVSLKETHKLTLQHAQLLLFGLGIDSNLSSKWSVVCGKRFKCWVLRIRSRESRKLFAENIGFTEPHKMNRLNDFVNKLNKSEKSGDMTMWPVGELFQIIYKKYEQKYKFPRRVHTSVKRWRNGISNGISTGALFDFLHALYNMNNDPDLTKLREITSGVIPMIVKSISSSGSKPVWDLEVTGDHEYSTGGLFSHNCEKSADVITYTYLNDQLRADGKFYLGNLKNRDNPVFSRMVGKIVWQSKRMRHIESGLVDLTNDIILSRSQRIARAVNLQAGDLLS